MANVKITEKDGRTIEISDITFDQVKQLVSPNGNGHSRPTVPSVYINTGKNQPNYASFKAALSEQARKFLKIIHENPNGISNDNLAEKMGFESTNQIGGVTGGGIGKRSSQFHIIPKSLWETEITRENGVRRVIYKAGPDIEKVL